MKDKRDSITNAYSRAAEARSTAELDAAKPLTSKQTIKLMNQLHEIRMQNDIKNNFVGSRFIVNDQNLLSASPQGKLPKRCKWKTPGGLPIKRRLPSLWPQRDACEFYVRHPWGLNALRGYERVAHHFNLHTMEVPASFGDEIRCLLVHKDIRKLRAISRIIKKAHAAADKDAMAAAFLKLKKIPNIFTFSHVWNNWAPNDDKKTLKALGWKRRIVTFFDHQRRQVYNVVIRTKASTLIFRSPGPNPNKKRKRNVE